MLLVFTALAAAFVLAIMPASGQRGPACFDYDKWTRSLERNADETKHGQGIARGGKLSIELWRTYAGNTWTLLLVDTLGRACLIAFGESWVSSSGPNVKENH